MVPQQIPLDLGHRIAMGREDFMISPSNRAAVEWIDRWPDWPAPALILYGPAASGKSHLGAVWRAQGGEKLVEDAEHMIGQQSQEEELFHLYNTARETGTHLLITALKPPHQWDFVLPDLASRLKAAPAVGIEAPYDNLLAALLVKLFHDRQLIVGNEVISYILPRMERSMDAARVLVEKIDQAALSKKQAVTVPLVSKIF